MANKKLCHFRFADDVITKLWVCARLAKKDKTKVLERMVRIGYDEAVLCMPERVAAIHAELEQAQNALR